MRSRSSAVDHDAAVARRLELLTHELAAVREGTGATGASHADRAWTAGALRPLHAVSDDAEEGLDDVGVDPDTATSLGSDVGWAPRDPPPSPPVARVPGRHASRRTTRGAATWSSALVPGPLRGRVWLGPGHVVAIAVVAVVGLVATCWFLVRGGSHAVAAPMAVRTAAEPLAEPSGWTGAAATADQASGSTASAGGATLGSPTSGASASQVVVDVAGKVRRPGIAVLDAGDRVIDAIRAAGGARHGVDLSSLNLARVLTDGEQIVVGGRALPPGTAVASGSPGTPSMVNLNTADQTALESLPEVGPVTAQAIIAWRTEHGGFTAVSQLLDVDGIGDATLAQITPYVTV